MLEHPRAWTRLLHPRPVVLVVSLIDEKKANVMAASWVTPVSVNPPLVAVCITKRRYTYTLIKKNNEFTINVPPLDMVRKVHYTGVHSGRDVNKIQKCNLSLVPAKKVSTPIIKECIAALECLLEAEYPAGDHNILLGRVIAAHVKEELFENNMWKEDSNVLLHVGANVYSVPLNYTEVEV